MNIWPMGEQPAGETRHDGALPGATPTAGAEP